MFKLADTDSRSAGLVTDEVDDDALLAVEDALVLGLVFLDISAVIARNMQVGARGARDKDREEQQGKRRDAHGSIANRIAFVRRGISRPVTRGPDSRTLAGLCSDLVKHPLRPK